MGTLCGNGNARRDPPIEEGGGIFTLSSFWIHLVYICAIKDFLHFIFAFIYFFPLIFLSYWQRKKCGQRFVSTALFCLMLCNCGTDVGNLSSKQLEFPPSADHGSRSGQEDLQRTENCL